MFVQDLKAEFYNRVIGKRVLMIVNYDIDGICASKILQSLFKHDHTLYTVVPIMGKAGLKRAYIEHQGDVKFVLLINCGGCIDIIEVLQPEEDITFFICDAHRPYDVCNIYCERQVYILSDAALEENIPPFEALFYQPNSNSENEDEDESDSDGENDFVEKSDAESSEQLASEKASRGIDKFQRRIQKERAYRSWQTERDRIMFDYSQYSYYGRSAALNIFELAWRLSKDNIDLLWWAIVGITEQLILGKIESSSYTLEIQQIQSHVSRLTTKTAEKNMSSSKICFENDLHLVLYRHWTVQESMRYSIYSASKFKLWTQRGENKLHKLLVEMGLPLMHARQKFNSMDLVLRKEFFTMVEKLSEKYGIADIVYGSFTLSYGYSSRFAAADYVHAQLAILESVNKDKTPEDCFLDALDSLSRRNKNLLSSGIEQAKVMHATIFKQVQNCIGAHIVYSTGAFFYYVLKEEHSYFSYPYALTMFAKFLLHGHVAMSRSRHAPDQPLIACCPLDATNDMYLCVGIPPIRECSGKNFFGKAFERAAQNSMTVILQDYFEPSIIQIKQIDLTRFLDALTVLLS